MVNQADRIGLTQEQESRLDAIDSEIMRTREGIAVWHRLLDRRRLDVKTGAHPITAFSVGDGKAGGEHGRLVKTETASGSAGAEREPFYVKSETEARALLMRGLGYLSSADGEKLAFDKGEGDKDKMAEWIMTEISRSGAINYIRSHAPHIFGIRIAVPNA